MPSSILDCYTQVNRSASKLVLTTILYVCIVASCETFQLKAQERVSFAAYAFEDNRFMSVLAGGNARGRKAHVTVFEVLGKERKLRKLHELDLINDCEPLLWNLYGSGRFLVTIDEFYTQKNSCALVIYDLVRNEHTAYRKDEIFPKDQFNEISIGKIGRWQNSDFSERGRQYNPRLLELSISTVPIDGKIMGVVVDLPTRTIRNGPAPKTNKASKFLESDQWNCSHDGDTGRPPLLLPKMLSCFLNENGTVSKTVKYRLETSTLEYEFAKEHEWLDEFPIEGCYDWTRRWRRGYWPWGQYPWVPPAWPRTWPGEDLFKWPEIPSGM